MKHAITDYTPRDLQARIASPHTDRQDKEQAIAELQRRLDQAHAATIQDVAQFMAMTSRH